MDRFEFLSDDWLGLLERTAQRALDQSGATPGQPVRYVEIFSGLPADLKAGKGYVLAFADGKASVVRAEHEDEPADCHVRIDYGVALATMRVRSGPDLDALIKKAFADGSMTMSGSPKDLPIDMNGIHNILIDQTAT